MPHTRLREALPRSSEVLFLCGVRALACLSAYASGFRALSDDDYARLSIAQRFAETPSFDPSHSSWLPAPFWVYGAIARIFGADLAVPRLTAIALSTLGTLLVYVAARTLGACRPGAVLGAALSTLVPYSALLGIATVPEVPCAALILFGAATLAGREPKLRALGGLALGVACLSRYEAWPVSAVFTALSLRDALQKRAPVQCVAAAALASLGPVIWLLVGRAEHGHALFFVTRVADYRRSLGPRAGGSLAWRLLDYPGLLLRAEPEICALFLIAALATWRFGSSEKRLHYRRPGLALLALMAFLMVGSVRDGVPTHHAARVLLPLWFFGCVLSGTGLVQVIARISRPARASLLALIAAATLFGWLARPWLLPQEGFAQRQLELAAGSAAKRCHAGVLAIDTPDYGYFAVQAAFGSASRSLPLVDHDPRHAAEPDPFLDHEQLARMLRKHGADCLVATREHAARARDCSELWHNSGFALLACPTGGAPPEVVP